MVAFLAGRSDGANYGKLVDYEFPRQLTVQGPQQVEARINQEPEHLLRRSPCSIKRARR